MCGTVVTEAFAPCYATLSDVQHLSTTCTRTRPCDPVRFALLQRPFERKVNETMRQHQVAYLQCDIHVVIRFTSGDNHGNAERLQRI
jgi:hypothetical protein